jgi:hypothetical protein
VKSFRCVSHVSIAIFVCATTKADVIFSSMPPRTWPGVSGIIVGGPIGSTKMIAEPFIPIRDFILAGASVAVYRSNSGTAALNIGVCTSLNGKPGATLETAVIPSSSISRNANSPTIASVRFWPATRLTAGSPYWLVLFTAPGTEYGWVISAVDSPPYRSQRNNQGWRSAGGSPGFTFEVTGQPFP